MTKKSVRPATRPQSSPRQAAADLINQAFKKSDIAEICHALAAATHLYNISDLAQKSGLARQSVHRAFAGDPRKPKFKTVLNVLVAMGFQLHVTVRRERQLEGIADAKARGAYKGREATIDAAKIKQMKAVGIGPTVIAKTLRICRSSVYRALAE